ncbi:MAG TPA: helix-turn-helix domain-containing protein [Patescibacteria group bacterium]
MDIQQTIEKLNLSQKQAAVYFSLLQLGSGHIQDIAKKAGLKRTTTYSILDGLTQKGFVTVTKQGAHRLYSAEDPRKLPYLFDSEIQKIKQQQKNIIDALPELSSLYNAHATKPKIRFYEGIEGLKQVFNETLELKKGEEILAFSSAESIHTYLGHEYVSHYLAQRIKRGIVQRAIAEDSPEAREHQKNDKAELRKTRLVDKDKFPFSNEINIFKNKMAIVSYKDLLGVIIESAEVSKTQKAIFELAWLGAKDLQK